MALRYDRRSSPAGEPGPVARTATGFTAADVGRSLSRERTRQGLSLQDVSARTGIPLDRLRAAETGVLDRPDGLATLKTVRRYADLLGLPGDRYALAILERWPTKGNVPPPFSMGIAYDPPRPAHGADTSPTAAVGALSSQTAELGSLRPEHGSGQQNGKSAGRAARTSNGASGSKTAQVRALPADQRGATWGYDGSYSDTGVTPAVRATSNQVWHRQRRRPPAGLQALVVVLTLAVLAGIGVLAVDRLKPTWLQAVGIGAKTSTASAAALHIGAARRSEAATSAVTLKARTTSANSAVFDVAASTFTVKLSASGGPCWVQVTSATTPTPLYAGIVQPGSPHTFSAARSLVVEMGSTSGRLSIASKSGHVATYVPPGAPYKITVQSHR